MISSTNPFKASVFLLLFGVSASLFLVGCAATTKASGENSQAAKNYDVPEGKGSVYLYRTGRAVGAAGQLKVKVNGIDAGGTGPGTFFKWDLKPGTYTFFSSTGESSAVSELNVKAGEIYFLRQDARIGISSGRVTIKEVADNKGRDEVQGCKLLVSAYIPE